MCDDDWTNDDTEVICRQAGKLGKPRIKLIGDFIYRRKFGVVLKLNLVVYKILSFTDSYILSFTDRA